MWMSLMTIAGKNLRGPKMYSGTYQSSIRGFMHDPNIDYNYTHTS